jgi:diguanylate cyclase (GGDEF)-like protein
LILLDVMMPRMSGHDVARALQDKPSTAHIPIIFVTAKSDMADRVLGLEMAIDYVCKPFAAPELLARVRAALRMGKLQEELRASNEQLSQLATTDPLTSLFNRRHFNSELEDEVQRSRRFTQPVALIIFDIDRFKAVNDTWGHVQGDIVLQEFARVISHESRSIDTVARFGGEEFAALLPATDLEGARSFADKVRRSVEELKIPCRTREGAEAPPLSVTVSAGAAVASSFDSNNQRSLEAEAAYQRDTYG